MSAPTEEEIRAALAGRWTNPADAALWVKDIDRRLEEAVSLAVAPLWWEAPSVDEVDSVESGDKVWSDLRPSEATRLHTLVGEAEQRAQGRCHEVILDELTAAALAFAAEHPDAPRAKREVAA